jgi:4-cresol dehydrogenase (hydroxylating)
MEAMTESEVPDRLDAALAAWRSLLGPEHVVNDQQTLERVATTTFATQERVSAILAPATTEQVQACVRIATEHRVPLYPVSRGTNWGLGGRVPPCGGGVILDLHRMNRVHSFDATLGTLTLEPGVTFRQVYEFLCGCDSSYWLSPIGGSDLGSVIANALERGEGVGALGERSNYVAALEVVTASGEVIRTGFSRFEGARTSALSRHGVGPSVDGLFAQSNLGIVTGMAVWLAKRPRFQSRFMCRVSRLADLAPVLDAVRELHHQRILTDCGVSVWNVYKYLALQGRYPWSRTAGKTPFRFAPEVDEDPVILGGYVHAGSDAVGAASVEEVRGMLAPHVQTFECEVITDAMRMADPTLDCGYPNPVNLRTAYWRKRAVPAGPDPEQDRCGVIWLCPALPFDGALHVRVLGKITEIGLRCGFEPHIGFTAISPRLTHMFISLVYDRDSPGEDARAMACHDGMLNWLLQEDLPPYRLGVHSMHILRSRNTPFEQLLRRIRSQLDPFGIIAPGRYVD